MGLPGETAESNVLVLSTVPRSYPGQAEARQILTERGINLIDPGARIVPVNEAMSLAKGVQGILVGGTHSVDAALLRAATELRVVVREGIGVEKIDLGVATEIGVVVSNTAGSNSASVADHTLALMLAVLRDLVRLDARIRSGVGWVDRQPLPQLSGSTIGVVGTGNVGRAVIERVAGFDVSFTAFDPVRDNALASRFGFSYCDSLEELLVVSDVVSLHAPLTPSTEGMIGRVQLEAMKTSAILVNTARGALIDSQSLIAALEARIISGAGLDAWVGEPVTESALFDFPNVVVTPHVGGNSIPSSFNARMWGARNMIEGLLGSPRDVVNRDVLSSPNLRL